MLRPVLSAVTSSYLKGIFCVPGSGGQSYFCQNVETSLPAMYQGHLEQMLRPFLDPKQSVETMLRPRCQIVTSSLPHVETLMRPHWDLIETSLKPVDPLFLKTNTLPWHYNLVTCSLPTRYPLVSPFRKPIFVFVFPNFVFVFPTVVQQSTLESFAIDSDIPSTSRVKRTSRHKSYIQK